MFMSLSYPPEYHEYMIRVALLTVMCVFLLPLFSAGLSIDASYPPVSYITGDTSTEGSATFGSISTSSDDEIPTIPSVTLRDPSFQELKDFMLADTTSRKKFRLYEYECRHFAFEVNNNAEAAGLRCGIALICYERGQHAVVVFETTDRGILFIEPQTDAVINPKIGGFYQGMEIKEILIAW